MAERDPLASILGTVIAAAVVAAILWPYHRRKQKLETEEVAKRVGIGGFTPLMYAATVGDTGSLTQMLAAGVDINAIDEKGNTALMHAVNGRQQEAVEMLLKAGADPNKQCNEGLSPVQVAKNAGSEMYSLFQATIGNK